MKRYLLTFKNAHIEEQYQTTCIGQTRMKLFQLIVLCFFITFLMRIVQCLLDKNYENVIINVILIVLLALSYLLTRKYQRIIRIPLFLLNHVFTIYLLSIEESTTDNYSAYLRGVNQMGTNLLLIFSGEFLDGVISLISLQTIRVIIVFIKSSNIEYFTIFSSAYLVGYASIQLHEYHKGLRSQFLLSIKDQQWDNILVKIIKDVPYLLLSFDDECLKYKVQSIQNCEKFITSKEEVTSFLKQPIKTGQNLTLEQLIHQEIKSYQSKCKENFNNVTNICINKKQLLLEYSIFNGNKPIILFIFKDIQEQYNQKQVYKKQLIYKNYFFNFFLKLCYLLQTAEDRNYYLKYIIRKLQIIKQLQNFKPTELQLQNLDLKIFFNKLQRLYPKKIILKNTLYKIKIETIIPLLQLFFLNLMESSLSEQATIHFNFHSHQYIELIVMGQFDVTQLKPIHEEFASLFDLIIEKIQINNEYVKFHLFSSALVPFNI